MQLRVTSLPFVFRAAGLIAVALFLDPASSRAADAVPFRSSGEIRILQSSVDPDNPGCLWLEGVDVGRGSVLGRYTSSYLTLARLAPVPEGGWKWVFEGSFVTRLANGDTLTVSLSAEGQTEDGSWPREILGVATILNGTGRMAGVQGSWTWW